MNNTYYATGYVDPYAQPQNQQYGHHQNYGYQGNGGMVYNQQQVYRQIDINHYTNAIINGIVKTASNYANRNQSNRLNDFLLANARGNNFVELVETANIMALYLEYRLNVENINVDYELSQTIHDAYTYLIALLSRQNSNLAPRDIGAKQAIATAFSNYEQIFDIIKRRENPNYDNVDNGYVSQNTGYEESFDMFGVSSNKPGTAPVFNMMAGKGGIKPGVGNMPIPAFFDADGTTRDAVAEVKPEQVMYVEEPVTEKFDPEDNSIGSMNFNNLDMFGHYTSNPEPVEKPLPRTVDEFHTTNEYSSTDYFESMVVGGEAVSIKTNPEPVADVVTLQLKPKSVMPSGYSFDRGEDDLDALSVLARGQLTSEELMLHGFTDYDPTVLLPDNSQPGIDYPAHLTEDDIEAIRDSNEESYGTDNGVDIDYGEEFDPDYIAKVAVSGTSHFRNLNNMGNDIIERAFNNPEIAVTEIEKESPALAELPKQRQEEILKKTRVAPAYLVGRTELYVVRVGDRDIIRTRLVSTPMKYHEHETETIAKLSEQQYEDGSVEIAESSLIKALSMKTVDEYLDEISDLERKDEADQIETIFMNTPAIRIPTVLRPAAIPNDFISEPIAILNAAFGNKVEDYDIDKMIVNYDRLTICPFFIDQIELDSIQNALAEVHADSIVDHIALFIESATFSSREKKRLEKAATEVFNRWIKLTVNPNWYVDSFVNDMGDLLEAATETGIDTEVIDRITMATVREVFGIYDRQSLIDAGIIENVTVDELTGADVAKDVNGVDSNVFTTIDNVTLVPFSYADYPIAMKGKHGVVTKNGLPKLYEVLSSYIKEGSTISKYLMVTTDNVVFTFCKSVVGDEIFIINQ